MDLAARKGSRRFSDASGIDIIENEVVPFGQEEGWVIGYISAI